EGSMTDQHAVVVVTGGGRGIGEHLVRAFAADGCRVVVADVIDEGDALARELSEAGNEVSFVRTDVGDEQAVVALADACRERYGHVDVLVNNAGIYQDLGRKQPFEEIEVADFERVLRVNTIGVWLVTKALVPLMRARGAGRVINTASSTVHMGVPNFV